MIFGYRETFGSTAGVESLANVALKHTGGGGPAGGRMRTLTKSSDRRIPRPTARLRSCAGLFRR